MPQHFIGADREQVFLMPPSLRDWLPVAHLAWFVLDAVEEMDLAAFYADYRADGRGRPAHDPAMMVALVLYAFAVGERSLRQIERRCVEDVAFRVLAGNLAPDHSTIGRFFQRHQGRLEGLFGQVLALCARAGLVRAGAIALDSTKIAASASGLANRSYEQIAREIFEEAAAINAAEDELYGEARGDELPPELADPTTRRARLRRAKAELEGEWRAEREQREAMLERRAEHEQRTGRRPPGRPPVERALADVPPGRRNITDPDSRPVKTPRGFIQGYNAHAVCSQDQIVLAAELTNRSADGGMLEPMISAARRAVAASGAAQPPETALADAGYWNSGQIERLTAAGLRVLVPPDGHARTGPPATNKRGGLAARMRALLASDDGGDLYRRRQTMIEPIFGDTKFNRRAERFRRRGLACCRAEWRLLCTTHNLLKLWRHTTAPAAA
jgi:transposase